MLLNIISLIAILGFIFLVWNKVRKNEIKDSKEKKDFNENIYKKRMAWLLGYLMVSIFLFWLWFVLRSCLTAELERILFCLASNFLGASLCGFQWRIRSKANPLPAYFAYYPLVIFGFSAFTFALTTIIINMSKISHDVVFYSLAFFIGIYCGQHIDNIKELGSIIKKIRD